MHIYVRKSRALKPGSVKWSLFWQWYDQGKAKQKRVPRGQYGSLGFPLSLTEAEARSRADQINAQETLKGQHEKRVKITQRLEKEELVLDAYLIAADVEQFEQKLLSRVSNEIAKRNKIMVHWRAAKRAIVTLRIDVSDWIDNAEAFYDYFKAQNFSTSYVQKVMHVLNKWGHFEARKYKKAFLPIPTPTGREFHKIADNYFETYGRGNDSDPLTPEQLESGKSNFSIEQYNWLFLSVWFGLRPFEVDALRKPSAENTWYVSKGVDGIDILSVYQTKLTSVSKEKRIKNIPCIHKNQDEGLKVIKSGLFERPLAKTVKKYFGENTTCYGGRKNFQALMQSFGVDFIEVSKMLGHTTISRTYKNYTDKQKATYKKVS